MVWDSEHATNNQHVAILNTDGLLSNNFHIRLNNLTYPTANVEKSRISFSVHNPIRHVRQQEGESKQCVLFIKISNFICIHNQWLLPSPAHFPQQILKSNRNNKLCQGILHHNFVLLTVHKPKHNFQQMRTRIVGDLSWKIYFNHV